MNPRLFVVIAALVGLVSSLRADAPDLGLVAHYKFDGNLRDSSGNHLNLTAGGVFRYVAGHPCGHGKAVQLVTAAGNGTFFLGTGPSLANQSSSIAFWVRKDIDAPGSWVFGLGHPAGIGGSDGQDMHVSLGSGIIRYSFFYNDFDSWTPLAIGPWYHLAFTYDNATGIRCIYINGVLDSQNTTGTPFTGSDALKVGYEGITLDDLRFYNRALGAGQVKALYQNCAGRERRERSDEDDDEDEHEGGQDDR
jgi:arabinan endo-1,5-alpha-L-arabinosidase